MIELSRLFPAVPLRLPGSATVSFLGFEPGRYACMALALSIAAASSAYPLAGPAAASVALAGCLIFFSILPGIEKTRRAREIESELPLFLRSLGMLLEFGLPLERALELASAECGALGREARIWLNQMREGLSFQRGLSMMALQYDSVCLKRALSSLIISLESGSRGAEIRKIGDDLLQAEGHRMREYAAKSALFGLVLIVVSAILPTFFLLYSSTGLGDGLDEGSLRLAMLVLFPTLSLFVILLSRSMTPRLVFGASGPDLLSFLPGAAVIAGYLLFPGMRVLMAGAGIALGMLVFGRTLVSERRAEEIERSLPDALLLASGMPRGSGPEALFRMVEEGKFGALSEEAGKSRKQLQSNVPLGQALDDLWRRNGSGMLRRGCSMLKQMIDSGSLERIGVLADDMIRYVQLRRERAAAFAMQKYTLIAGALIIPLIMRMALGLLETMGSVSGGPVPLDAVESLVPPYLLIYSTIASSAIADYEGKKSSAAVYLALMGAAGLLTFQFINF